MKFTRDFLGRGKKERKEERKCIKNEKKEEMLTLCLCAFVCVIAECWWHSCGCRSLSFHTYRIVDMSTLADRKKLQRHARKQEYESFNSEKCVCALFQQVKIA